MNEIYEPGLPEHEVLQLLVETIMSLTILPKLLYYLDKIRSSNYANFDILQQKSYCDSVCQSRSIHLPHEITLAPEFGKNAGK